MYVLMREFPSDMNQHDITYDNRAEGVTKDLEVAQSWCKDIGGGWGGKQYFVEVPEITAWREEK